jgi:hypothetical protein
MSLAIDVDRIEAVLLPGLGWMTVARRSDGLSSFSMDAYEYVWPSGGNVLLLGGGMEEAAGVPATGFEFTAADGKIIAGPITTILAVRYAKRGK